MASELQVVREAPMLPLFSLLRGDAPGASSAATRLLMAVRQSLQKLLHVVELGILTGDFGKLLGGSREDKIRTCQ